MTEPAERFRQRLKSAGLSESAISAAWPEWWSEAADSSSSALAELRFSVARKLGLDPRSLFDDEAPRFIWDESVKYKNFKGADGERPAIASFGTALANLLLAATPAIEASFNGLSAQELRAAMLAHGRPFIELRDLMALSWGVGTPVVHLKVYPLVEKRMCAMSTRLRDRNAILLARDSEYPAPIAFHLAHEIAHIALGHVKEGSAIVDMTDAMESQELDDEESAADSYALELLTGSPKPDIVITGGGRNAAELAREAQSAGARRQIEPGTLALCAGFVTGDWPLANAALRHVYSKSQPVWAEVNGFAIKEMNLDRLTDESSSYVRAVLGAPA